MTYRILADNRLDEGSNPRENRLVADVERSTKRLISSSSPAAISARRSSADGAVSSGNGGQLLTRDPPFLLVVVEHRSRQPCIPERGVSPPCIRPARHYHGGPLDFRASPRVERLSTERPPPLVVLPGTAEAGEGGGVATALGGAVAAVAELVRPCP